MTLSPRPLHSHILPTGILLLAGCFPGLPGAPQDTLETSTGTTVVGEPTTTDAPVADTTGSLSTDTTGSSSVDTPSGSTSDTPSSSTSDTPSSSTSDTQESFCGDGVLDGGEECDLGVDHNGIDGAQCTETCALNICGDSYIAGDELCDDGNNTPNDGCSPSCEPESCGDGIVQAGEECDDGNQIETDGCVGICKIAVCGDKHEFLGVEECDDGNNDNTDACVAECKDAVCGDGFVGPGEACDDGNQNNNDACTNACALASCGDGVVQPPEECDDSNLINTDDCLNTCKQAKCGDGVVHQDDEACDDGDVVNDDECTNDCVLPVCGDGIKQAGKGEECDDGDNDNNNACMNNCKLRCGNKVTDSGEACDDGNADAFFCDNTCKRSGLVVFVTSQKYNGDFNGLTGADAACNSVATGAGLIGKGTYVAWMSDQTGSAEDRTTPGQAWQNLPYRTLKGVKVVEHFWYAPTLLAPINVTQSGQTLASGGNSCATAADVLVWTGSADSGNWSGTACNSWLCCSGNEWPPQSFAGTQGRADKFDSAWTEGCSADCETTARLYCIETPK